MAKSDLKVTAGPGRWELLHSFMHLLEPTTVAHVTFTFQGDPQGRSGRVTGFREAEDGGRSGALLIEGYFFNGSSPYKKHGTPFSGLYNPTTRIGSLTVGTP